MTATNLIIKPHVLHFITDAAGIDRAGCIVRIRSKRNLLPKLNAVMQIRGSVPFSLVDFDFGKEFTSFYHARSCLPEILRFITGLLEKEGRTEATEPGCGTSIWLAGWPKECDRPEVWWSSTNAAGDTGGDLYESRPEYRPLEIYRGPMALHVYPLIEAIPGFTKFTHDELLAFDAISDGRRLLQRQRETLYGLGKGGNIHRHAIGGYGELTTITREGMTHQIIISWPEDRVGQTIQPFPPSFAEHVGWSAEVTTAALNMEVPGGGVLYCAKVENLNGVVRSTATKIDGLEAKVGNFTAGALIALQTTANSNAARSRIWLKVRVEEEKFSAPDDDSQAAMLLEAVKQGSGDYSQVGFVADRFFIADSFKGSKVKPFLYKGGELSLNANVTINGDLFVNGEITTKGLAPGAIGDIGFAYKPGPINAGSSAQFKTLVEVAVECDAQGMVVLDGKLIWQLDTSGVGNPVPRVRIQRVGGGTIYEFAQEADTDERVPFQIITQDISPANGLQTYRLQFKAGSGTPAVVKDIALRAMSQKRGRKI